MSDDDGRITNWPAHMPGTRSSWLNAGHAAGQTGNGGRTPTAAERNQAEAIRAAIKRGDPVTPAMRMSLGLNDSTTHQED